MVSFIDDHRATYGVEPICRVLPIAPSTYYEQKARQADLKRLPARAQRDNELRPEIERVWRANRRIYGAKKVWKQLKREGIRVALHGRAADGSAGLARGDARSAHSTATRYGGGGRAAERSCGAELPGDAA